MVHFAAQHRSCSLLQQAQQQQQQHQAQAALAVPGLLMLGLARHVLRHSTTPNGTGVVLFAASGMYLIACDSNLFECLYYLLGKLNVYVPLSLSRNACRAKAYVMRMVCEAGIPMLGTHRASNVRCSCP